MKARTYSGGNISELMEDSNMENYKSLVELNTHKLIPMHVFLNYARSLNDNQKLILSLALKLPFSKKDLKRWPEVLFLKKLSEFIKKTNSDLKLRKQIFIYLMNEQLYATDEIPALEDLQNQLQPLITQHGYWSVYWTVYLHREQETQQELWEYIMKQLSTHESALIQEQANEEVLATSQMDPETAPSLTQTQQEISKLEKKILMLEDKISKETKTRQQLEYQVVQKDKQIRQQTGDLEKLQQQLESTKLQLEEHQQKMERNEQHRQELQHRWREEQDRWIQERNQYLQNIRTVQEDSKKVSLTNEQLVKELEDTKQALSYWQGIANQKLDTKESQHAYNLKKDLAKAMQSLHLELDKINKPLLNYNDQYMHSEWIESNGKIRSNMKELIQLAESIECFVMQYFIQPNTELESQEKSIHSYPQQQLLTSHTAQQQTINSTTSQKIYGTFYRRDHGGYVTLESGETFNITESLVQQLELQHEAEVLCTPTHHPGRNNHYTIELLFQGDDHYSPIQQFDGFVEQDEDQKWYCIDLNDETNRYPIHFKDIEIQKPAHGDPCTFNVAEEGYIARLTRLYRVPAGEVLDVHPARKKSEQKSRDAVIRYKQKPEPFLEGCTITIIGGQRKWFESVVKETGAELVHDGGERPERIATDLSKSQALFMILTSTSHRATWEGIDIAKANGIPHYIIQGSKSNLRMLLWENQEQIRNANRELQV